MDVGFGDCMPVALTLVVAPLIYTVDPVRPRAPSRPGTAPNTDCLRESIPISEKCSNPSNCKRFERPGPAQKALGGARRKGPCRLMARGDWTNPSPCAASFLRGRKRSRFGVVKSDLVNHYEMLHRIGRCHEPPGRPSQGDLGGPGTNCLTSRPSRASPPPPPGNLPRRVAWR